MNSTTWKATLAVAVVGLAALFLGAPVGTLAHDETHENQWRVIS